MIWEGGPLRGDAVGLGILQVGVGCRGGERLAPIVQEAALIHGRHGDHIGCLVERGCRGHARAYWHAVARAWGSHAATVSADLQRSAVRERGPLQESGKGVERLEAGRFVGAVD
eukprot:scaffold70332_cov38-Prasinocladus_malaysianus.AAC.1